MTEKLKPCPFCGGEAEIERAGTPRFSTIYACTDCGCRLETGEEWGHGTAWNTRPSVVPDREGVARIIDPEAWEFAPWNDNWTRVIAGRKDNALAKADAILSLLASQEG